MKKELKMSPYEQQVMVSEATRRYVLRSDSVFKIWWELVIEVLEREGYEIVHSSEKSRAVEREISVLEELKSLWRSK